MISGRKEKLCTHKSLSQAQLQVFGDTVHEKLSVEKSEFLDLSVGFFSGEDDHYYIVGELFYF